jgi:hypothetical protein
MSDVKAKSRMLQQEKRNIYDQISAADDLKKQQQARAARTPPLAPGCCAGCAPQSAAAHGCARRGRCFSMLPGRRRPPMPSAVSV